MGYGPNIKAARKKAGLTQEQLAKKCGIATITLRQYELGKRKPPLKTVEIIAEKLSVDPFDLAGDGDEVSIHWINLNEQDYQRIRSQSQQSIEKALDKLNYIGQEEAVKRVEELTEIPKYQKDYEPPQPE